MAQKIFSFRLDDGLVSRIDAVAENRTAWVRSALEAALGGEVRGPGLSPKSEKKPQSGSKKSTGSASDPGPSVSPGVSERVEAMSARAVREVPAGGRFLDADRERILSIVRERSLTERDLERLLVVSPIRIGKAVRSLLNDGLVVSDAGVVRAFERSD